MFRIASVRAVSVMLSRRAARIWRATSFHPAWGGSAAKMRATLVRSCGRCVLSIAPKVWSSL